MIKREVFTKEYILKVKGKERVDPSILERSIYALGLVEALCKTSLDFIFKGGSCLMVLFDKPLRLSTDVDIVVSPGTDIIAAIEKASEIYPFLHFEEEIRQTNSKIHKRHFIFYYESIWKEGKETPILLDVLFEENHYPLLLNKEIKTSFIETEGKEIIVKIPGPESILGDKLTAFAPKTIGIKPVSESKSGRTVNKKVEVIKQFFDVASLFDEMTDYEQVRTAYIKTAETELKYRGLESLTYKDCLVDTYNAALSILTKGKYLPDDYPDYLEGIRGVGNFIINEKFNAENAYSYAAKIMYLAACLYSGHMPTTIQIDESLLTYDYAKNINNIKRIDPNSFNMAAKAIRLMNSEQQFPAK